LPFKKNDDSIFPKHEVCAYYDFGDAEDEEWLVDDILTHQWKGNDISFLVQWNLGDTTWEPYTKCKELAALDRYLELLGIKEGNWCKLPRKSSTDNKHSSNRLNTNMPKVHKSRRRT